MRSSFVRNASTRERRVTYTPMFTKIFVEKSPGRCKSSEDLELLKAERLKTFWELFSYESYYTNQKSIKARVTKVLISVQNLIQEVKGLSKSIETDNKCIIEIENTIKAKYNKKTKKNWINHTGIAWQDFWLCKRVENRLFCIQVLINQSNLTSKIKVSSYDSQSSFTFKFDCDSYYKEILKDSLSVIHYFCKEYLPRVNFNNIDVDSSSEKSSNQGKKSKELVITQEIDPLYECFDNQCIIGTHVCKIGADDIFIILFENVSISTYLLQMSYKGKTYNFTSSQYPEEFDLLFSLQFSTILCQKTTLFKSLEFSYLLENLLKKINT